MTFQNNVVVLGTVALGAGTFAVMTAFALLFNRVLLGAVLAGSEDLPVTLALVLSHGVVKASASVLVAEATYRVTWRLVAHLGGSTTGRSPAARPLRRSRCRWSGSRCWRGSR